MKHVSVYDGSSARYVAVRGYTSELFKAQRVPAMRDKAARCSWVRRERLSDVVTMLEAAGFDVRLIEGDPR